MATIINIQGKKRLVIKGASEIVLECCNKMYTLNSEIVPLDNARKDIVLKAIDGIFIY